MGLQRKIGSGMDAQVWQPYPRGPCSLGRIGWDHSAWARVRTTGFWGTPFCHVAQAAGETLPGRKGEKGLLLVSHKKVPHDSELTGDCGGNTANGAGTEGLPEPRTSTFLRYGTPDQAKGGRKDCVCLWMF